MNAKKKNAKLKKAIRFGSRKHRNNPLANNKAMLRRFRRMLNERGQQSVYDKMTEDQKTLCMIALHMYPRFGKPDDARQNGKY